ACGPGSDGLDRLSARRLRAAPSAIDHPLAHGPPAPASAVSYPRSRHPEDDAGAGSLPRGGQARLTRAPTVVYGPRMVSRDTRTAVDRLVACYAIVRRDNIEIFRALKAELEEPDVVEVIWDRRVGPTGAGAG